MKFNDKRDSLDLSNATAKILPKISCVIEAIEDINIELESIRIKGELSETGDAKFKQHSEELKKITKDCKALHSKLRGEDFARLKQ